MHPSNNNSNNNQTAAPSVATPQLNRSNTGTSNVYPSYNNQTYSTGAQVPAQPISSVGLTGQGYAAPTFSSSNQTQRPLSAGVTRSASNTPTNAYNNPVTAQSGGVTPATNHIPISSTNNNNPQNATSNPNNAVHVQSANNSQQRPKSAGAVRPSTNHTPISSNPPGVMGNPLYPYSNSAPTTPQPQYKPPQQQQTPSQQPSQPYYSGYAGIPSSQSSGRPLSANATSLPHSNESSKNFADNWSAAYKLMYGGTNAAAKAVAPPPNPISSSSSGAYIGSGTGEGPPSESGVKVGSSSSTPAIKLRNAVDLSHRLDNTQLANEAALRAAQLNTARSLNNTNQGGDAERTNLDDGEGDGDDLDAIGDSLHMNHRATSHVIRGGKGAPNAPVSSAMNVGDDDEMDGKPINESRSHPEVSTTTPSQSVELAHGGSSSLALGGALDGRGEDSLNDDMINIGVSTVPNQFCTKRDALELRKLLMLSVGTRGGIVPSSSAVMDM